jgi:hypothetical protein
MVWGVKIRFGLMCYQPICFGRSHAVKRTGSSRIGHRRGIAPRNDARTHPIRSRTIRLFRCDCFRARFGYIPGRTTRWRTIRIGRGRKTRRSIRLHIGRAETNQFGAVPIGLARTGIIDSVGVRYGQPRRICTVNVQGGYAMITARISGLRQALAQLEKIKNKQQAEIKRGVYRIGFECGT